MGYVPFEQEEERQRATAANVTANAMLGDARWAKWAAMANKPDAAAASSAGAAGGGSAGAAAGSAAAATTGGVGAGGRCES